MAVNLMPSALALFFSLPVRKMVFHKLVCLGCSLYLYLACSSANMGSQGALVRRSVQMFAIDLHLSLVLLRCANPHAGHVASFRRMAAC